MTTDGISLPVSTAEPARALSCPSFNRSWLKARYRVVNGEFGYDEIEDGFDLAGQPSEAELGGALRELDAALAPGDERAIALELARLRSLTKAKDEPGVASAYLQELRRYPAWAVIEACRECAESEKFFPAWAELHDRLERKLKRFRQQIAACERALRQRRGIVIEAHGA